MAHAQTAIGFDADHTLWQNEQFFRLTEKLCRPLGLRQLAEIGCRTLD